MVHAERTTPETFDILLGSPQAERFIVELNQGLIAGLKGSNLQAHISKTWEKYRQYVSPHPHHSEC